MRIDAHQHFWQYQVEEYDWITGEISILQRDFLPPELKLLLERHAIDGCIAVEARGSEKENSFLLDLAEKHSIIKGVVGWLDLRSTKVEGRLKYYAHFPKLKGFRYNVQVEKDPNFLLRQEWIRGMKQLEKTNFTFDILIFPHQLSAALELVRQFPDQKFVIDHLAKPYIKDGFYDGWALMMKEIGKQSNVWCKVSGMVTEADWENWSYEDFVPYLDLVFEAFGTERIMYGSDWPVCLLAAEYSEVVNIVETYIKDFSEEEKGKVFGENAETFYKI